MRSEKKYYRVKSHYRNGKKVRAYLREKKKCSYGKKVYDEKCYDCKCFDSCIP